MVNDPKEILDILNSFDNIKFNKQVFKQINKKEDKKKFTPTPIISPIYGLLDEEGNTGTEIALLQKQAYYQGRADEEKRWKPLKDDLTSVYLDGFYDGEKKWKNKIKKEIEEYKKYDNGKNYENEISVLENVLKEKKR